MESNLILGDKLHNTLEPALQFGRASNDIACYSARNVAKFIVLNGSVNLQHARSNTKKAHLVACEGAPGLLQKLFHACKQSNDCFLARNKKASPDLCLIGGNWRFKAEAHRLPPRCVLVSQTEPKAILLQFFHYYISENCNK
jgi:hypothetical protein